MYPKIWFWAPPSLNTTTTTRPKNALWASIRQPRWLPCGHHIFFPPKKIFHAPGVLLRDQWFHFWNSWAAADAISSNWSHFLKKIVGRSRNIPWQNHIICLEEKCEMWEVIFGVVINKFCIGTYLLIFSFNSVSNWINFVLCDFVKEYYQQLMIFFLKNDFSIGKVGQNFIFFHPDFSPTVHVGIENEHLVFMREWISLEWFEFEIVWWRNLFAMTS